MKRILITGATGQIGTELTPALRECYGGDNVVAVGHKREPVEVITDTGPYVSFDIRDRRSLEEAVAEYNVDTIYHLVSLLSAVAEKNPQKAWEINVNGLINVLETARLLGCKVFHPSSIGVFGPTTPKENTPQETIQRPNTLYGVSKVTGELLCDYYYSRYCVDCRGLRFPGLISHVAPPGGGTTDYAVDIFYAALTKKKYTCFLASGIRLDMMYMSDAVRAAMELMEADPARLRYRCYNISAMSFGPDEIYAEIRKNIADFVMDYDIDPLRQSIAESWPNKMDDGAARQDWNWQPEFDLQAMVKDMLKQLSMK